MKLGNNLAVFCLANVTWIYIKLLLESKQYEYWILLIAKYLKTGYGFKHKSLSNKENTKRIEHKLMTGSVPNGGKYWMSITW